MLYVKKHRMTQGVSRFVLLEHISDIITKKIDSVDSFLLEYYTVNPGTLQQS